MRFEICYSSGTRHEVVLPGSVVVLGRDPGCDIVLNDARCSRQHAVVEERPEGLLVRDTGSANGVYLNGRRVDRAAVRPGDVIRIGDVRLTVRADIGETVVVALDESHLRALEGPPATPAPVSEPQRTEPGSRERPRHSERPVPVRRTGAISVAGARGERRPLTVSVLSTLWALSVPAGFGLVAWGASRLDPTLTGWLAIAAVWLLLAAIAAAMASGLRRLAPWARNLQIAAAYLGLLVCPFTLASATVLLYLNKPEVRRVFEPGPGPDSREEAPTAEPTFAVSILAMLLVGTALSVVGGYLLWPHRS